MIILSVLELVALKMFDKDKPCAEIMKPVTMERACNAIGFSRYYDEASDEWKNFPLNLTLRYDVILLVINYGLAALTIMIIASQIRKVIKWCSTTAIILCQIVAIGLLAPATMATEYECDLKIVQAGGDRTSIKTTCYFNTFQLITTLALFVLVEITWITLSLLGKDRLYEPIKRDEEAP